MQIKFCVCHQYIKIINSQDKTMVYVYLAKLMTPQATHCIVVNDYRGLAY